MCITLLEKAGELYSFNWIIQSSEVSEVCFFLQEISRIYLECSKGCPLGVSVWSPLRVHIVVFGGDGDVCSVHTKYPKVASLDNSKTQPMLS